jgi:hypothetical protein
MPKILDFAAVNSSSIKNPASFHRTRSPTWPKIPPPSDWAAEPGLSARGWNGPAKFYALDRKSFGQNLPQVMVLHIPTPPRADS